MGRRRGGQRWTGPGLLAAGLFAYIGLPYLLVQRQGLGTVRQGRPSGERVALTFDDGPDPQHTPAVLDALKAADMRATFFLLSGAARRHPELVRRILAEGHEIGVHAARHRHAWVRPPWEAYHDPVQARRDLERLSGTPVRWGRPPHGAYSLANLLGLRRAGLTPVQWSIEGGDWERGAAPQGVKGRVLRELHGGAVIVLHDSGPGAQVTPAALPGLLRGLAERGFYSVTLSELDAAPVTRQHLPARLMAGLDRRLDRWLGIRPALGRQGGLFRLQPLGFPLGGLRWPDGTPIPRGTPALEFHVNNPLLVDLGLRRFPPRARREFGWVAQDWRGRPELEQAEFIYCLSVHGPVLERLGFLSVPLAPHDQKRLKLWSDLMHRAYGTQPRKAQPVLSIMSRDEFLNRFGRTVTEPG
ncbi:polysaccharide deacetylase family protein [Deinococcus sp. SL84]|uniref:polysaccharide deacetylase family protein n=1 Tax=Deinococcus sp. SL84 TaxID=2994663 RepID=UPI002275B1F7|nr:polysaccharide deacetylase family protein [Deinococcus sp. SL84]MCY1701830.1 polysaccharide deacetylase family protein [Deinococcus sp. SL84]